MRLAIMQPYLFPYIGYFQLFASVDTFIVYDDVTFIKQGWINRNNILLNEKPFLFTVPLLNASSNTLIKDTMVSYKQPWADKLLKTLTQAYRKAPQFGPVSELVSQVLNQNHENISQLAAASIEAVGHYLGITTTLIPGSSGYGNLHLTGQDRVIDICKQERAMQYHNPAGGQELYARADFAAQGIDLFFIKTPSITYPQYKQPFVPWLSIIDVLMFNEPAAALQLVKNYELV